MTIGEIFNPRGPFMNSLISNTHSLIVENSMKKAELDLIRYGEVTCVCTVAWEGGSFTMDTKFMNDAHKDVFAIIVRAMAIRHRATTVTLVTEGWVASAGWAGRPSQDPNRTEAVTVIVERHDGYSITFGDIRRDPSGKANGLEVAKTQYLPSAPNGGGRFECLLPSLAAQADEETREAVEELLSEFQFEPSGDWPAQEEARAK